MPVDKFNMGGNGGCGAAQSASWGSPVGLVHRAGDTMLGELSLGGFQLKDVGNPLDSSDAATKEYVDTRDVLPLSGGSMRGALHMGGNEIAGLADPQTDQSAATKKYVDALVISTTDLLDAKVDLLPVELVHKAGDTMLGDLSLGGNEIVGLADPKTDQSAATKKYVDALVRGTMALLDDKVLQIDGSKAPTHDIRWGNHRISELADPKSEQDAATKAYVDAVADAVTMAYVDEIARALGKRFDIYEISLQWKLLKSLSLTPIGIPQLTQLTRNPNYDIMATLAITAPGVYKIQLAGVRTGSNHESTAIALHIGHPLTLVLQHPITDYGYFNTSGVCVISQPSPLQLSLSPVPTSTSKTIVISAKLLLEKLD